MEGFDPRVIGDAYDAVAGEYAGKFGGELESLPLDRDRVARAAPGSR